MIAIPKAWISTILILCRIILTENKRQKMSNKELINVVKEELENYFERLLKEIEKGWLRELN